jgi:predicted Mrr-cat superfamily restriction endonuclease
LSGARGLLWLVRTIGGEETMMKGLEENRLVIWGRLAGVVLSLGSNDDIMLPRS